MFEPHVHSFINKSANNAGALDGRRCTCSQWISFGPLFLRDLAQGTVGTLGTWTMCLDGSKTGPLPPCGAL